MKGSVLWPPRHIALAPGPVRRGYHQREALAPLLAAVGRSILGRQPGAPPWPLVGVASVDLAGRSRPGPQSGFFKRTVVLPPWQPLFHETGKPGRSLERRW